MKVTIYTAAGVLDSPDWDVLPFLTFTLDDTAVSRVRRDQVTRIDIE